ncbi:hypothetical protein Acr_12g0007650 [Actinidia rufa]|uniref:Uncharacterized protein n=1 Tax=Actinidia rufa TaxID=165716 RepID=A0A7J0FHP7_9ERIC|nr:hypothetical protein Acr_12g0007650 [Actinidia rufa]
MMTTGQYKYLTDAPLDSKDPSHVAWKLEDAQIRLHLLLSLGDMSLEDYYGRFRAVCEEIDYSESISSDIVVMQRERESIWVACFLYDLPSSFDGARPQILGAKDLPSLSEVFNCLHQATLPPVAPPTDCSGLATSIGPSCSSGLYHLSGFGCGQPSRPSSDYPRDNRGFGCKGRDSGEVPVVLGFALITIKTIILLTNVGIFKAALQPIRLLLFSKLML